MSRLLRRFRWNLALIRYVTTSYGFAEDRSGFTECLANRSGEKSVFLRRFFAEKRSTGLGSRGGVGLLDNALQEYLQIIGKIGGVRNADCGKPSGIDYASSTRIGGLSKGRGAVRFREAFCI